MPTFQYIEQHFKALKRNRLITGLAAVCSVVVVVALPFSATIAGGWAWFTGTCFAISAVAQSIRVHQINEKIKKSEKLQHLINNNGSEQEINELLADVFDTARPITTPKRSTISTLANVQDTVDVPKFSVVEAPAHEEPAQSTVASPQASASKPTFK